MTLGCKDERCEDSRLHKRQMTSRFICWSQLMPPFQVLASRWGDVAEWARTQQQLTSPGDYFHELRLQYPIGIHTQTSYYLRAHTHLRQTCERLNPPPVVISLLQPLLHSDISSLFPLSSRKGFTPLIFLPHSLLWKRCFFFSFFLFCVCVPVCILSKSNTPNIQI